MKTKTIAIIMIILLVINMILFGFRKISNLTFWIIIIIAALFAYKVMPKMKKN